jgi:RimJ/RimL family protein N-acetyltransferase
MSREKGKPFMTVFQTPRLLLRPVHIDDLQVKWDIDRHPDVYQFQGFVRLPNGEKRARPLAATREKLEQRIGEFALQGFGMWAVVLKESNTFVGWSGLQFYLLEYPTQSLPEIELYYGLSRAYWGQGIIHEACQQLIEHGFRTLKLPRITSVVHRENIRSLNVARRNGMRIIDHPTEKHNVVGILDNPALPEQQASN